MQMLTDTFENDRTSVIAGRIGNWTTACFLAFVILAPFFAEGDGESAGEGNLLRQVVYVTIFGAALVCARIDQRPAALLQLPVSLFLTLAWFCASVGWASNPGIAGRRLALTLIVIWSVFLLANTVGYKNIVRVARHIFSIVLVLNFCAVFMLPEWAIHQAMIDGDPSIVGAWRGVLMQKNFAGVASALTIILFAFDADDVKPAYRWTVMSCASVFLYHTNSRTSMFLLLASILIGWLVRFYRPFYRWMWCILLMLSVPLIVLIFIENIDLLAAPFSNPDAFTGRVVIWMALLNYARDHLLLGSGFGSFWNAGEPHALAPYTHGWVISKISSGHSGFLDVLVQTGLPGLLLSILAALLAPLWRFMKQDVAFPRQAGLLLALITFCFLHNVTESGLFDRDATVQVFLMLGIALLYREGRKA